MQLLKGSKKGVGGLGGHALEFVVIAMVIGFGALILANVKTQVDTQSGTNTTWNSTASTAVFSGITSLGTFGNWLPILAIVIVAGVVIAYLLSVFGNKPTN